MDMVNEQVVYDGEYILAHYNGLIKKTILSARIGFDDFDDCYQCVFLRILEKLHKFDSQRGNITSYVHDQIRGGITMFRHPESMWDKKTENIELHIDAPIENDDEAEPVLIDWSLVTPELLLDVYFRNYTRAEIIGSFPELF